MPAWVFHHATRTTYQLTTPPPACMCLACPQLATPPVPLPAPTASLVALLALRYVLLTNFIATLLTFLQPSFLTGFTSVGWTSLPIACTSVRCRTQAFVCDVLGASLPSSRALIHVSPARC